MIGRTLDGVTLERGEGGWFVVACGWEFTEEGACWRFCDTAGPVPDTDSALYVIKSYCEWANWRATEGPFASVFTSTNTAV